MKTPAYRCRFFGGSRDGETRILFGLWDGLPIDTIRSYQTGEYWKRRPIAKGFGITFVYELVYPTGGAR